jgi:hypothetical protein
MGWDYCRNWHNEGDVIRAILKDYETDRRVIVDHALAGNVFWVLFGDKGGDFIGCYLIDTNGYKAMCAEMHPFYYTCPQRIVDATPSEYAKPWKAARSINLALN